MVAPVVDSLLDLVGATPIVCLSRLSPDGGATIWGKCEQLNPGGSVKDRIALAMIDDAERRGLLRPGSVVVEPTSGNTGIGLALVCAARGYELILTMPESMSLERRQLLEAYGAKIVLTSAERVMDGAIEKAHEIAGQRGAFMPMQFENSSNPRAHVEHTAREILAAFEGLSLDAFVAAVGTGGTVSGVGSALKSAGLPTRIVAVEPSNSPVLSGGEAGPTKIQGIGAGFVPKNFDRGAVDEIRIVGDRLAWETKARLAREEGLLVGVSAGANVAIAIELARELGPGKNVLAVLCDTGERYFSLDEYFQDS
jgi:cysteine synthase A